MGEIKLQIEYRNEHRKEWGRLGFGPEAPVGTAAARYAPTTFAQACEYLPLIVNEWIDGTEMRIVAVVTDEVFGSIVRKEQRP